MPGGINRKHLAAALAEHAAAPQWWVGFSGGVDSTALLHLVNSWRKAQPDPPPLTALHINHGLQASASEWENHCAWICRFLDIPFLALSAAVEPAGKGSEAAAREARYALFEQQLEEGHVLFLGQHLDDQVETFFLRLLRGAGVDGLGAMPRQRELGRGILSRPLLDCTRAQLQHHVDSSGLRYIDDPSNEDTAIDRNFLRREVLPLLAKRWPGYRKTVIRASEHLAGAAVALEQALDLPETCFSVLGDPGLDLAFLQDADDQYAAQLIRAWLKRGGMQAPDSAQLQEFLRQLRKAARSGQPLLDTGSYCLQRYRDAIYLLPRRDSEPEEVLTLAPGETRQIEGVGEVSLQRCAGPGIWLAADEETEIRWRRGGERARSAGGRRSASLKKWLQEEAIPPWWRERVPLLYLENQLLAVGGLWPCHSSRWGEQGEEAEAPWQLVWEPAVNDGFD